MQALGQSQVALQTQTGITTPPTTTPSAGHEVEVGHQTAPQGAQTAKKYPKLQTATGIGTVFSASVLTKQGLQTALGATPSNSAKAKTAFASAFNKVANVFGFKGVRKSDFVGINKAVKEYAQARTDRAKPESTVATAELRDKLLALKEKVTSHQTRHPGKLENLGEVSEMVDAELEKLDLMVEIEALDASPAPDKAEGYTALLRKFVSYSEKHPSNLSSDEEKALVASLHKKISGDGGTKVTGGVHKLYMECIQTEIRSHAQKSTEGTLLRGNGDVLLSKPHAYAVVNDHLKGVVTQTVTDIHGGSLEIDPNRLAPEELASQQGRVERLGVCFENFCDNMGISSDPGVQKTGIDALPQELCDQAKCLYEEVLGAGHDEAAARRAVTSLVMLKLVCPMLMAPQGSDASPCRITDQAMSPEDQRNMTILSKVVQNLANGVSFKEEYMLPFNDLLTGRKEGWGSFVDGVVARGRDISTL